MPTVGSGDWIRAAATRGLRRRQMAESGVDEPRSTSPPRRRRAKAGGILPHGAGRGFRGHKLSIGAAREALPWWGKLASAITGAVVAVEIFVLLSPAAMSSLLSLRFSLDEAPALLSAGSAGAVVGWFLLPLLAMLVNLALHLTALAAILATLAGLAWLMMTLLQPLMQTSP